MVITPSLRIALEKSRRMDRWKIGGGWPEAAWPMKAASEIVTTVADDLKKLKKKAFPAVVTRAQSKKLSGPSKTDIGTDMRDSSDEDGHPSMQLPPRGPSPVAEKPKKKPWVVNIVHLVDPRRFISLSKLYGTIAWTRRETEQLYH